MPRKKRTRDVSPPKKIKIRKIPQQHEVVRRSRLRQGEELFSPQQHPSPCPKGYIASTTTVAIDGTYTHSPILQTSPYETNTNMPQQYEPICSPEIILDNQILNLGLPTLTCSYCGAQFWKEEVLQQSKKNSNPIYSLCCREGSVDLSLLQPPPALLDRLLDINGDKWSKHYRKHIRSYNAAFSWTSFGAKFDPKLLNSKGPYSLILCGENLHYMGSLLPEEGQQPKYAQLYVFDPTSEVNNRLINVSGEQRKLDKQLMEQLQQMLDNNNVLAQSYRRVRDALQIPGNQGLRLRITGPRIQRNREYDLPTGTELAGLIPGDFEPNKNDRDIIVNNQSTGLTRITSLHPLYDSLHFPLLFPQGGDGFHDKIEYNLRNKRPTKKRQCVTQNEYYNFRLQYRKEEGTTLIRSGKALQHFCIDAFTTVEQNRLLFIKRNQTKLRAELYQGLRDALDRGDLDARNLGNIICPSSFTGGVRYMRQLYFDAIAICQHYGNPDLFITFTCNAQWPEITNAFASVVGTHAEDKPMIVDRVFKMKLGKLKEDLTKGKYFGLTIASIHSIEFQKKGLPHAHLILWLSKKDKPTTPSKVDKIISAELPDPQVDPIGYEAVTKFMLHGPCGANGPTSPCMKDDKCSKYFPKSYCSETTFDENGYAKYRRRETGINAIKSGHLLDNTFVVPYNRNLLVKYQGHINIEICHKGQLIKYLFKYITKVPDRSKVIPEKNDPTASTSSQPNSVARDEVGDYLDCRSISSYEAIWRLFQFKIHERSVPVVRLCVHMPGAHMVSFPEERPVHSILNTPGVENTMLTEWFVLNRISSLAREYTYSEIPQAFVWNSEDKRWTERKRGFAIGRMATVPPKSTDVFYLRILLTKVKGAISYEDLRTIDGVIYKNYQDACVAMGLLSTDEEWNAVMSEVCQWGMAPLIRTTFVSLLLFCEVASPNTLFEQWWPSMADDFKRQLQRAAGNPFDNIDANILRNQVLLSLQVLLQNQSSSLSQYNLPNPTNHSMAERQEDLISQQLDYDISREKLQYHHYHSTLNSSQQLAHDAIMSSVDQNSGKLFFLYGHGGTGKTYLYNCIISKIRSRGQIALVVASSGIAATLLPGGVTAHSRFKIPIDVDHASTCSIKKGTNLARLLQMTTLIVWDEAPMVHRHSYEALDRSLCDIMQTPSDGPNYKPFGGKTVLLGGDFRQTLPIVTNGGRAENLAASLTRSTLWNHCTVLHLTTNMRITNSVINTTPTFNGQNFSEWVLALGNGTINNLNVQNHHHPDYIAIPEPFILPKTNDPISALVAKVYPNIGQSYKSVEYIRNRAIVTPTNKLVTEINNYILTCLPGEEKIYYSSDSLTTFGNNAAEMELQYPTEFLNKLSLNGMPEHELRFKPYTVVMLLRNINPTAGLCNGTRILLTHLANNVLRGLIIGGSYEGTVAIIPRIILEKADPNWPFTLKRRQYPVRICYAMTINKSQGQTLEHVGLYLPTPVFSHGQLYVAVSRVRSAAGIHIVIENDEEVPRNMTKNIVYQEIFEDLKCNQPV